MIFPIGWALIKAGRSFQRGGLFKESQIIYKCHVFADEIILEIRVGMSRSYSLNFP